MERKDKDSFKNTILLTKLARVIIVPPTLSFFAMAFRVFFFFEFFFYLFVRKTVAKRIAHDASRKRSLHVGLDVGQDVGFNSHDPVRSCSLVIRENYIVDRETRS